MEPNCDGKLNNQNFPLKTDVAIEVNDSTVNDDFDCPELKSTFLNSSDSVSL